MRHIESAIGTIFVSSHAYDRMDRHGIDCDYVEVLVEAAGDDWELYNPRGVADVARDGVVWRLVVHPETDDSLDHDWDLVTVTPRDVDVDVASEAFGEADALTLAFYTG